MDDWMTIPDVARELGLAPTTIHARIQAGTMRAERVSPRLWLIPRAEVERWKSLGRQKRGPRPRKPEAER